MRDNQLYYLTTVLITSIFQSRHRKTWLDQEWEVLTIHWTRHMNTIHRSTMQLEEAPLLLWTTNHSSMMITKVRWADSHRNQERIQLHILNIKVLSQATISWKFKDLQLFLSFRVFWLKDLEKLLKIEVAEELSVSPDNSKSLMIMVQVISISMNSQKQFKISKLKLKKLILKVYLNQWI